MKFIHKLIKFRRDNESTLTAWRDDFLLNKRVKLEETTLGNYKRAITLYIHYVGESHWPPTRLDVLAYLDKVKKNCAEITVFTYWSILRAWFNYMAIRGAFGNFPNPAQEIKELELAPGLPKLKPKGVPEEHVNQLLEYLRALPDTIVNVRDLTLIHFLYRAGARSGEAATLTRKILELEMNRVFVEAEQTKDDEDRSMYFGQKLKKDLDNWIKRLEEYGYEAVWVFPSTLGNRLLNEPLTISGINQMFHRRLRQIGLPIYRVHDLRHSFTREAIRQGKPLSSIQKQLGHATSEMVLRYAQAFNLDQQEAFSDFGDD